MPVHDSGVLMSGSGRDRLSDSTNGPNSTPPTVSDRLDGTRKSNEAVAIALTDDWATVPEVRYYLFVAHQWQAAPRQSKAMKLKFWYTDLSKDSGCPWFATHLNAEVKSNGNPQYEIRIMMKSLNFWRVRLFIALCGKLLTSAD